MPLLKEHTIEKVYWQIGEVSKALNVSSSLIRYWLEFFEIKLQRNSQFNRAFNKKDIEKVINIYYLIKVEGRSLKVVKKILNNEPIPSLLDTFDKFYINLKDNANRPKHTPNTD